MTTERKIADNQAQPSSAIAPFDPATIPPRFRAVALIGREVRVVEWLPDEQTENKESETDHAVD